MALSPLQYATQTVTDEGLLSNPLVEDESIWDRALKEAGQWEGLGGYDEYNYNTNLLDRLRELGISDAYDASGRGWTPEEGVEKYYTSGGGNTTPDMYSTWGGAEDDSDPNTYNAPVDLGTMLEYSPYTAANRDGTGLSDALKEGAPVIAMAAPMFAPLISAGIAGMTGASGPLLSGLTGAASAGAQGLLTGNLNPESIIGSGLTGAGMSFLNGADALNSVDSGLDVGTSWGDSAPSTADLGGDIYPETGGLTQMAANTYTPSVTDAPIQDFVPPSGLSPETLSRISPTDLGETASEFFQTTPEFVPPSVPQITTETPTGMDLAGDATDLFSGQGALSSGPAATPSIWEQAGQSIMDKFAKDPLGMGLLGLSGLGTVSSIINASGAQKTAAATAAQTKAAQAARQAQIDNPGTGGYGFSNASPLGRKSVSDFANLKRYGMGPERKFFDTVNPVRAARGGLNAIKGVADTMRSPLESMVRGPGGGQDDTIPAMLSDGEYVMDAETVSALGDGSTEAGARKLDQMREGLRRHKRATSPKNIPPKSKSPESYMRGKK